MRNSLAQTRLRCLAGAAALMLLSAARGVCGDWPQIPPGHRILRLVFTPARFLISPLVIPRGMCHFEFVGLDGARSSGAPPAGKLTLSRIKGSRVIRSQVWDWSSSEGGVLLQSGQYLLKFATPGSSRGVLRLVVRDDRASVYPVVSIRESRYRSAWPPILLFTAMKGGPVEVYLNLTPGRYRFHDIAAGLESASLRCLMERPSTRHKLRRRSTDRS